MGVSLSARPDEGPIGDGRKEISMSWQERIVIDPQICHGKPTVRGTRIMVTNILGLLADGYASYQVQEHFPELHEEDVKATIRYAIATIGLEEVIVPDA